MKNIYLITKGQLITMWVFGVIAFFAFGNNYDANESTISLILAVFVPFALIFYTLGYRQHKKSNQNKND